MVTLTATDHRRHLETRRTVCTILTAAHPDQSHPCYGSICCSGCPLENAQTQKMPASSSQQDDEARPLRETHAAAGDSGASHDDSNNDEGDKQSPNDVIIEPIDDEVAKKALSELIVFYLTRA